MSADQGTHARLFRRARDAVAARFHATVERAHSAMEQHTPLLERFTRQMVRVNILDCATRIGTQAFLTAIPVLFVIAAFAPAAIRDQLLASLRAVLGVQGATLDQVRAVYSPANEDMRHTYGEIGILITLLSATGCSRAVQRLCERSWHVSHASARVVAWRWLAWFGVWLVVLVAQSGIRDGLGVGTWLGIPLSVCTSTLLWWWTQRLLLRGRIGWLPLLPGALLTGLGMLGLVWASKLYLPNTLNRSIAQFGPLGSVFTLLSWMIVACVVVSMAVATGYVIAHEQPFSRWLGTEPDSPAATGVDDSQS